MTREIRSYDYINQPYERVRHALHGDALGYFRDATKAATSRAESVAAELRVNIAGIDVSKGITIRVHVVEDRPGTAQTSPSTHMSLEWEAADSPHLFPLMRAELAAYPLTPTETQLDFSGDYELPLGPLGSALDAVIGHRIAEASVHRFLRDVAEHLRKALA